MRFILIICAVFLLFAQSLYSQTFQITGVTWTDKVDNDQDEYTKYRKLNVNITVSENNHTCYATINYRKTNDGNFITYYKTDLFVVGADLNNTLSIDIGSPNTELAHGGYDFLIYLYKSGVTTSVAQYYSGNTSRLADQKFETSSEDNNAGKPDLTVIDPAGPASANAGETINVKCTVKNIGDGGAASSHVGYYISQSQFGTENYLGNDAVSSLVPQSTSPENENVVIPSNLAPGNYYIVFWADYQNTISKESNEDNNRNSYQIKIAGLKANSANINISPGAMNPGGSASGTGNISGTGTGNVIYTWELKRPNSAQWEIYQKDITSAMTNGSAAVNNIQIAVFDQPGTYLFRVRTISPNEVLSNEASVIVYTVQPSKPDVTITSFNLGSTSVQPGASLSVSYTIKNNGPGALNGQGETGIYLSKTEYGMEQLLAADVINTLGVGQSVDRSLTVTLPKDAASGNYYIVAAADCYNKIDEANEGNNNYGKAITVKAPYKVPVIFPDALFKPKETKIGCPVLLEARLLEDNQLGAPVKNVLVNFQININGQWVTIPEDNITTTSLITDRETLIQPILGGGYARNYYVVNDTGEYQVKVVFEGNDKYQAASKIATLKVTKSKTEAPYMVSLHEKKPQHTPILLVHGNNSEEKTKFSRWDNLIKYLNNLYYNFNNYDVYVWKHDTDLPVGFNGTTGNAKELAGYIEELKKFYTGKKFILVAHSRGGLVCRSYMNYNHQDENILGLLTLATPHYGSPLAVPDWTAITWANTFGNSLSSAVAYNYINEVHGCFKTDRMGDLNLAWSGEDGISSYHTNADFPNISFTMDGTLMLTESDFNFVYENNDKTIVYSNYYKKMFGDLRTLNKNKSYFNKIIAYAAYDNDLSNNNFTTAQWEERFKVLHDEHAGLLYLTYLHSSMSSAFKIKVSQNYYANDGLVPLQSSLLLDVSGGSKFSTNINNQVSINGDLIKARMQVRDYRIFNNTMGIKDHLDLLDAPLTSYYWHYLADDIRSFTEIHHIAESSKLFISTGEQNPADYSILESYPNPFNPSTTLKFGLLEEAFTKLIVFDALGREVKTIVQENLQPGVYYKLWDGKDNNGSVVPSGIYFCRLQSNKNVKVVKLLMLK